MPEDQYKVSFTRSLKVTIGKLTLMYERALLRIERFEVFFSCPFGSCFLRVSKHVLIWARLFFSSLLWLSRVPDRI